LRRRKPNWLGASMPRLYRPRAAVSGLLALAGLLLVAGVAYGTSKVAYSGKTSQHERISFAISGNKLIHLAFWIDVHCPSHHTYRLPTSGFTPVPIKNAGFDQKFKASNPAGTLRFRGHVGRQRVTGSIAVREFIPPAHHFCSGGAKFVARPTAGKKKAALGVP
ncbi:MAG: hypothetical protein M3018_09105, partial [Actinomycetota bacterium]|nr:hypothetical protein [Actinomycetota bacterium]